MAGKRHTQEPPELGPVYHKPKPWSWREVDDIDFSEWILVLRRYVLDGMSVVLPEGARRAPPCDVGHVELVVTGGIHALQFVGGRGWDYGKNDHSQPARRGRPPLPRWNATDDLYPVLAFAAQGFAWKVRRALERPVDIASRLGCEVDLIETIRRETEGPRGAVPHILAAFPLAELAEHPRLGRLAGYISLRTLKTYHAQWLLVAGRAVKLYGERALLEWKVRFFLQRCPLHWLPPDTCAPPCGDRNAHHACRGHL